MVLRHIIKQLIVTYGVPIFKSFIKAYSEAIAKGGAHNKGQFDFKGFIRDKMGVNGKPNPNDPFGKAFADMMSNANITHAAMTESMAFKILGLEAPPSGKHIDPKIILNRYANLLDKNNPELGGSLYLQSKIITAKDCLMDPVHSAKEI